ncbi:DsbA family protein [Patescibacteria group bacterium]|nr:DsbA family protein [Patescibacteria group bacterium]MBU1967213.1 DsbA family protein [Patescibacteria group bacterium]MBU2543159.1 DsbA family protein [Patescibacteria group bacterium]
MKNLPLLLSTLLVTTVLVAGVVFVFSKNSQSSQEVVAQAELLSDAPHIRGPQEAQVTIVEFSDFQCPACKTTQTIINKVLLQYPDQVRLIYRHFPLNSIHPNAQLAAQATEVAAEDSKFWEYHDLLFSTQAQWSKIESKEEYIEQLASYAEQLGIDKATFLERIESDHIKSLVAEDLTAGGKLNIQGTPTFYVNGQSSPASQLLQIVESIINN